MEAITKFLEKVGVDNQIIAQLKDPEEGLNVDELADEFKASQKEVYANNPDVIKELEKAAAGKARGSCEREIKRVFDITADEWEENKFSEEKDYKKVLNYAKEKLRKDGNKTAEEIQQEKQELVKEIKHLREEEIPNINSSWQTKIDQNDINRHYRKLIGESGELIISPEDAAIIVNNTIKDKGYLTELTEDRIGILFKTKDGLTPQDEDGTRNLTPKEVVKSILDSKKLIKQSNADNTPPLVKPVFKSPQTLDNSRIHPAARENLEKVKNMQRQPRVTVKPVKE